MLFGAKTIRSCWHILWNCIAVLCSNAGDKLRLSEYSGTKIKSAVNVIAFENFESLLFCLAYDFSIIPFMQASVAVELSFFTY